MKEDLHVLKSRIEADIPQIGRRSNSSIYCMLAVRTAIMLKKMDRMLAPRTARTPRYRNRSGNHGNTGIVECRRLQLRAKSR